MPKRNKIYIIMIKVFIILVVIFGGIAILNRGPVKNNDNPTDYQLVVCGGCQGTYGDLQ